MRNWLPSHRELVGSCGSRCSLSLFRTTELEISLTLSSSRIKHYQNKFGEKAEPSRVAPTAAVERRELAFEADRGGLTLPL